MKTLEKCENIFGKMSPEMQKQIKKYIKNPNHNQWNEIAHYIINSKGRIITIWDAVISIDPTFPKKGRTEDAKGNVIKEWEKIPSPLQILQAINNVC